MLFLILCLLLPNNLEEDLTVKAIIQVESQGNDLAWNAWEGAAGCMQIRPIMVLDINRIQALKGDNNLYTYNDRWNCVKSQEMFWIYVNYYGFKTPEQRARGWNGGPYGNYYTNTWYYWRKVNYHYQIFLEQYNDSLKHRKKG